MELPDDLQEYILSLAHDDRWWRDKWARWFGEQWMKNSHAFRFDIVTLGMLNRGWDCGSNGITHVEQEILNANFGITCAADRVFKQRVLTPTSYIEFSHTLHPPSPDM